jgi:hypothetical protein
MEVVVESKMVDVAKHGTRSEEGVACFVQVNTKVVYQVGGRAFGAEGSRGFNVRSFSGGFQSLNDGIRLDNISMK